MAESHNIQIRIDASQAKAELRDFNSQLGNTARALSGLSTRSNSGFAKLSEQVTQLAGAMGALKGVSGIGTLAAEMDQMGKALGSIRAPSTAVANNIRQLGTALSSLKSVSGTAAAAKNIQQLATALSAIRVPNASAIQRLPQMLAALSSMPPIRVSAASIKGITDLANALGQIKTPSGNAIQRLPQLIQALSSVKVSVTQANNIAAFGQAFANFRAPSTGAVNNILTLVRGLAGAQLGNINQITTSLQRLSGLSINVGRMQQALNQRASQAGGGNRSPFDGWAKSAQGATTSLRGLENAFSATYHISSLMRTAMGSLTLGAAVKGISETGNEFLATSRSMNAVAASSTEAGEAMQFIDGLTRRLPISLSTAVDGFGKFAVSSRSAGTSAKDTQTIFEGFATAAAGIGLNTEKQKDMFLAVEQIMTKGKFAAQELNQQLANSVPGIKSMLAQSLGISLKELEKQMNSGGVSATKLVDVAKVMMQVYGSQVPTALRQSAAQMIFFSNEFTRIQNTIFNSGFNSGLAAMFDALTKKLQTPQIQQAAERIGEAFGQIFVHVGALGSILLDNIEPVAKFAAVLGGLALASTTIGLLKMIAAPILSIGYAAIMTTGALATFTVFLARTAIVTTFTAGAEAAGLLAVAINAAAGRATLLGKALKFALYGALIDGAAHLGTFLGEKVNEYFPNFAGKVQQLKDNLSGDGVAEAGKAMGTTIAQNTEQSLWEQIKGFDILGTVKEGIAAIGDKTGLDTSSMTKGLDEVTERIQKQQQEWQKSIQIHKQYDTELKRDADKAKEPYTLPTGQEEALLKKLKDAHFEAQEVARQMKVIDGLSHITEGPYKTSAAEREQMKFLLAHNNLEKVDPYAAEVRTLTEELQLLKLTGNAREEETKFLQIKNALLAKNKVLTGDEEAQIRNMIKAQMELQKGGSNGFQQWANGVKDLKDSLNDVEKNAVEGLSDALSDLVVKGKADFAALGQSILKSLSKALIDDMMKDMLKNVNGGLGSLFGFKGADIAGAISGGQKTVADGMSKMMDTTVAQQNVTAGVVYVNGNPVGGSLGLGSTGVPTPGGGTTMTSAFGAPTSTGFGGVNTGALGMPAATGGSLQSAAVGGANIGTTNFDLSGPVGTTKGQFFEGLGTALPTIGAGATGLSMFRTSANGFGSGGVANDNFAAPALPTQMPQVAPNMSLPSFAAGGAGLPNALQSGTSLFQPGGGNFQPPATLRNTDFIGDVMKGASPAQVESATKKMLEYAPTGSIPSGGGLGAINGAITGKTRFGQDLTTISTPNGLTAKVDAAYADRFQGLIGDLKERGYDFKKFDGFADRNIRGSSTKISEHAKGDAIDLNYYTGKNGEVNALGSMKNDFPDNISDIAKARGLKWGGDFKSRPDPMHFEVDKKFNPNGPSMSARNAGMDGMQPNRADGFYTPPSAGAMPGQQAMNQAMEASATRFQTAMGPATQGVAQQMQGAMSTATQGIGQQMQGAFGSAQGGVSSLTNDVSQLGSAAGSAQGGLSQLISQMSQMGGGGGGGLGGLLGGGGGGDMLGGMFSEGGYSTSPVATTRMSASSWAHAPHYAEGTHNTSGGMPAVLHPNEAVIPLSRGRSIPVEMNGNGGSQAGQPTTLVVNLHGVTDHDSFKRSESQMKQSLQSAMVRAQAKG